MASLGKCLFQHCFRNTENAGNLYSKLFVPPLPSPPFKKISCRPRTKVHVCVCCLTGTRVVPLNVGGKKIKVPRVGSQLFLHMEFTYFEWLQVSLQSGAFQPRNSCLQNTPSPAENRSSPHSQINV